MSFYTPTVRLRKFTQLTPEFLKSMGIRAIVTDLDDTLAARNCFLPEEEVALWVAGMLNEGIQICIVSNNHKKRTEDFASPLGIPCFYEAKKPLKPAVLKALKEMGTTPDDTILLGDQLFTDMVVAKRCHMKSVLVDPVGTFGGWFVQFKRKIEAPLRKKIPYYSEA